MNGSDDRTTEPAPATGAPDPATGRDDVPSSAREATNGSTVAPIAHADLTRADLPHPREPFEAVVRFAYTFDAYSRFGMTLCGEMANRALSGYLQVGELPAWLEGDLERLRACLYFEARRWILLEREPDTRALIYVHRLIDAIGSRIDAAGAARTDARAPAR